MEEKVSHLLKTLKDSYLNLSALDPNNKLLVYMTASKGKLHVNHDPVIKDEFVKRFGEVSPGRFKSFEEYQSALARKNFGNYRNALDEEIKKFIFG